MLRVRIADGEQAAIDAAVNVLARGGVVAYPTDTLYGLAVNPRSDAAVRRLYDVKGRGTSVAVPLIAASLAQALEVAWIGREELRLVKPFWPGPLSVVLQARPVITPALLAGGKTVVVRVPNHAIAVALASTYGFAITSTSANLSGQAASDDPDVVAHALGDRIDCLLDAGLSPGGLPSTIVELRDGAPVLVRAGAIPFERVLRSTE